MNGSNENSGTDSVRLFAVGGGACRVIERLAGERLPELRATAVDTDARELERLEGVPSVRIGKGLLRGLGCGGDPEVGRTAAESDRPLIAQELEGADLVILIACLGRGCASGAAPVLAGLAGEAGCPTVAIVSEPFEFEGRGPAKAAREAIVSLRKTADCVIVLPNDLLFQVAGEEDRVDRLFETSDEWMVRAVHALTGPMFRPGKLPTDLAAFRAAIRGGESRSLFSTCRVKSSDGIDAVRKGIFDCPLRSPGLERASAERLLISVGCGKEFSVSSFAEISRGVAALFDCKSDAAVALWEDERLADEIEVTVIARTSLAGPRQIAPSHREVEVHASKLKKPQKRQTVSSAQQTEFDSLLEHNERGLFGRMEVDAYDGVDLDKPTFLRRGIKIPMPKN